MLRKIRRLLAERRERRETARVHAAWRAEACAPEALEMAREMAVHAGQ